jgi:hypothetical protein
VTTQPAAARPQRTRNRLLAVAVSTVALLGASLVGAVASAAPSPATAGCSSPTAPGPSRVGRIGGIVHPQHAASGCAPEAAAGLEAPYLAGAVPPLVNHGGPVMGTQATGDQVVVTPIFWEPSGFAFTSGYKTLITGYLDDLAADSGKLSNVFATMFQYSGSNGAINYKMSVGTPIDDTTSFPTDGCTLASNDTTLIYADGTGYSRCLDDAQVIAETQSVVTSGSLPSDLGHLYVLFLPKHVESCFNPGSTGIGSNNSCTLNHQPSAAYCAYHSFAGAGQNLIYANMPFPAYTSGTGFSCTSEGLGGGIQQPNGDADADVEISPLSHEMAEAITDPRLNAWFDTPNNTTDFGNENGDDCAYIYGTLSGAAGAHYNQTINGHHYLTQEEFSNHDFVVNTSGCLQGIAAVRPAVTALSSAGGPAAGGGHLTITGTGFPGASAVHFGAAATTFTVLDASHIDASIPAGAGVADVTVTTAAGASPATAADHYTYTAPTPTVTGISPVSGPTSGGQHVTITGTGFTNGATVAFDAAAGTAVTVVSPTSITVTTPKHAKGTVDVRVTTSGGPSPVTTADRYTYRVRPKVTGLSRTSGPRSGGTKVTITGSGFAPGSTVRFGSTTGKKITVVSSTKITVVSPRHAAGRVHVTVKDSGGTSATSSADRYTFT